jgi:hypothetical protein
MATFQKLPLGKWQAQIARNDIRNALLPNFRGHGCDRKFYSKICAAAIRNSSPHNVSPTRLYELLTWHGGDGGTCAGRSRETVFSREGQVAISIPRY